jgi:hypothetical protein
MPPACPVECHDDRYADRGRHLVACRWNASRNYRERSTGQAREHLVTSSSNVSSHHRERSTGQVRGIV